MLTPRVLALLAGGTVVTAVDTFLADVAIAGGVSNSSLSTFAPHCPCQQQRGLRNRCPTAPLPSALLPCCPTRGFAHQRATSRHPSLPRRHAYKHAPRVTMAMRTALQPQRVVAIAGPGQIEAHGADAIDAAGKYVIPGGVRGSSAPAPACVRASVAWAGGVGV